MEESAEGDADTRVAWEQHGDGTCTAAKRKADFPNGSLVQVEKRRRVDAGAGAGANGSSFPDLLPVQIWQEVFAYLEPRQLLRVVQTSRAFKSHLTDIPASVAKSNVGRLRMLDSNSTWARSRVIHHPTMPRPLPGLTEHAMWQLLGGQTCQFCGKTARQRPSGEPWQGGPGDDGVRIVWPFGIRSCGRCLMQKTDKDTNLFFSTNSAFLVGLPFIFITQQLHVVLSVTLKESGPPGQLQISKRYYLPHVREIERQSGEVRAHGQGAAEEWIKGLETVGKERRSAAVSWEHWELKGGLRDLFNPVHRMPKPSASPASTSLLNGYTPSPAAGTPDNTMPLPQRPANVTYQVHQTSHLSQQPAPHRPERSVRDATEAKAARRADIDRRCMELEPPLLPSVLQHMESYRAALQISVPMTDQAWEVLLPRLLAQREAAEQFEHERASRRAILQASLEDRRKQDAMQKEIKELQDKEWEDAQKPIRDQLGAFADKAVRSDWANGKAVTKDNSSLFAADVLTAVRRRWYTEVAQSGDPAQIGSHHHNQNGETPRKLVLEHMKWVFDTKIKPHTEKFRREIFLCNGEGCEESHKLYGFEGVIQHYGAKHTTDFSVDNIVVHWRSAEWPEEPPFQAKPGGHGQGSSHAGQSGFYQSGYSRGATLTPQVGPTSLYSVPQMSPSPYGQPIYPGMNGPFAPPPATSAAFPFYQQDQYGLPPGFSTAPAASMGFQYPATGLPVPFGNFGGDATNSSSINPAQPNLPLPAQDPGQYGAPSGLRDTNGNWAESSGAHQNAGKKEPAGPAFPSDDIPDFQAHQDHLNELTEVARNAWKMISGLQDLPTSVRVFAVIHTAASKFQDKFKQDPDLNLLEEAFTNQPSLWPLKNANGLACRVCTSLSSVSQQPPEASPSAEKTLYSLSSLVSHFKSHLSSDSSPMDSDSTFPGPLDWKKDMIDVPTAREIRELLKNKDRRLELVEDAFSEALAHAEREMDAQPQEATSHADTIAGSSPFGNAQAPGTDEYDPSMMFPQGAATPEIKIKAEPAPDEPINQGILAPGLQSPLPAISRSPSDMPRFREDEYDPSHPARGQDVVRFERPLLRQGSPGMEYPRPRRQVIVREPYEDIYSPPRRFYRSYEAPSPVFRSRSAYLVYPEYERPMERPPLMVRQEGGYSYPTYQDAPGMDTLGPGDGRSRNYGSATVGREISKQSQSTAAAPRTESLAPGQPPLDIPTETGHGAAPPPPPSLPPVSAPEENPPGAPTEQDPQPADDLYARSRSQQPRHHSQDGRQYYDDRPQTRHVYGTGRHYYRGPHYHHEPRVVRSRNTNFARYNAEHRRLARNRSQSPGGSSQPPDAARQAYRERSPEPRPSPMEQEGDYRRASYPSREYHEFVPVEEYDDYRPGPPPVRYRYADQPPPPPMYVDEYGRPLQVVSYPPAYARSPPRRYMAPHNIDEAMEYVPHDAPPPDAVPYGDREYVYYSSDRRGYEYESAPPPPPGIARRGYAGADIR